MPIRKAETFTLGAVDSRSNPCNFPPERSIRCLNWSPAISGALRLRSGYAVPMPVTADNFAVPLHTLIYYEQFSASMLGPQSCLYGKNNVIFNFNMNTGVSMSLGFMPNRNPWGHFRSNNRIFFGDGDLANFYGFNFGFLNWDGTTLRPTGIPTMSTSGTVSVSPGSGGSFVPTVLTGYQLFGAWYNPITQHMGNCTPIGNRVTITGTTSTLLLSGLGTPPSSEWVTAIGMTNDGGQLPYWLVDVNGNHVVVGNAFSNATIRIGNVDALSELPFRNFVPPAFDKFARVLTRIFANKAGSPFIYHSNDVADVQNANYIGNPEESWPLDQADAFPTGEQPTAIHSYRSEGWFFSRNNLVIWNPILQQQNTNPWRGPYPKGCAGQRAFVETPYGPYWVTVDKELCTFMEDGVLSASEEYEAGLLNKLATATIGQTELTYLCDPESLNDEIIIRGLDKDGNVVVIIHDFKLMDSRSPLGCGYQYSYVGATPQTFAGAGYTPRQTVFDTNGKQRIWMGTAEGFIAQIEDDDSLQDGTNEYNADWIGLLSLGPSYPSIPEIEFQGDSELQISTLKQDNLDVNSFDPAPMSLIEGQTTRYGCAVQGGEARIMYTRLQLTSHSSDPESGGNFKMSDPPFLPLPTYGIVNAAILKLGRERPEAR